MREFSVIAKTDEPARDAERKQVGAAVLTVIRAFDFTTDVCGVTRTKVHQGRTGPHQASINRINSRSRTGYMDVSNMEVSTSAGNYLAGNTFRESQPDMMKFFSTHIGTEEFDPTKDIKPQLCSLQQTQPGPHLNLYKSGSVAGSHQCPYGESTKKRPQDQRCSECHSDKRRRTVTTGRICVAVWSLCDHHLPYVTQP